MVEPLDIQTKIRISLLALILLILSIPIWLFGAYVEYVIIFSIGFGLIFISLSMQYWLIRRELKELESGGSPMAP